MNRMALLIVGLGNPGKEYARTRHNAGFLAIDALLQEWHLEPTTTLLETNLNGQKIIFLKPDRFMNRSGEQVAEVANRFHIEPKDIVVVYDEATLPFGTVRTRVGGSAGGHNGIKSIIERLGTDTFNRVRIGIGEAPDQRPLEDWVLSTFSSEAFDRLVTTILPRVVEFVKERIETGSLKEHTVVVE